MVSFLPMDNHLAVPVPLERLVLQVPRVFKVPPAHKALLDSLVPLEHRGQLGHVVLMVLQVLQELQVQSALQEAQVRRVPLVSQVQWDCRGQWEQQDQLVLDYRGAREPQAPQVFLVCQVSLGLLDRRVFRDWQDHKA
jgi:hypothetical protein